MLTLARYRKIFKIFLYMTFKLDFLKNLNCINIRTGIKLGWPIAKWHQYYMCDFSIVIVAIVI